MRTGVEFEVSNEQRKQLEVIANDRNSKMKHITRARIVLMSGDGLGTMAIVAATGSTKQTVWRWQTRFMEEGVDGLFRDKTRKSEAPPHRRRDFRVYNTPNFDEKTRRVAGLYMDPPYLAVVLSVDRKAQILPLVRKGKNPPMNAGLSATMKRDGKRSRTATLVAALNALGGKVIGRRAEDRQHQEFISFLERIDKEMPEKLSIHAILGNNTVHMHGVVMGWLAEHPRWIFHFTPASYSWMDAVESFFGKLARRQLRRGVHHSIGQLEKSISQFIELHEGKEAEAYSWTASSERRIDAVKETSSD